MKRVTDVIFAGMWLTVTAPLIILITFLIKLESQGPVLYFPVMVGHKGKLFRLFRFRTMSADVSEYSSSPGLTRVGAMIRNFSLDHLPILVNLLLGDLTIIGPRPMEVRAVDLADPIWQQYFEVKPGVLNYAVLQLGKCWTMSRVLNPALNQTLELEYREKRSSILDVLLVFRFLKAYIASGGNVKARGTPKVEIEGNGKKIQ